MYLYDFYLLYDVEDRAYVFIAEVGTILIPIAFGSNINNIELIM